MARNFNGTNSDHVDISYVSLLSFTNQDFSIAAWFYNTGSSGERIMLNHQSNYRLKLQGGGLLALDGSSGAITSTTVPSSNVWHHALATFQYSSTTGKMYLDGNLDNTITSGIVYTGNTNQVDVGRTSAFGGVSNWHGNIAEIAIWNRTLTTNEAAALGKGVPAPIAAPNGLVFYMPLHGVSTTEPDLSGNKNNGTVTGTTVVGHAPVGQYPNLDRAGFFGMPSSAVTTQYVSFLSVLGIG